MRVRLSVGEGQVRISCSEGVDVTAGHVRVQGAECRVQSDGRDRGRVVASAGGRSVGTNDTVWCRPRQGGRLLVNGRGYRGSVLVFRDGAGLCVVDELGLDEYLYGVVPCEIGSSSEETFEAVKAQAVAARSFTLTRLGRRRHLGFDLYDSYARDQEYRGAAKETHLSRRAVDETRGEVLMYRGQAIEALYHATCGGRTANGSQPYLKSIVDAPRHSSGARAFCAGSRDFTWEAKVSADSVARAVQRLRGLATKPRVSGVSLETDRRSGRVNHAVFATGSGKVRVGGSELRTALGLRSHWFSVRRSGGSYLFRGRGWGHGSGLCQSGAVGMARAGSNYRQILLHYYSGVKLGRRW